MARQDYTPHQKKIIDRYYENLDAIMLTKLQELATELYLAESQKKQDRLWDRVTKAMAKLGVPESIQKHILERRSPEVLARNLEDWLRQATKRPDRK